MRFSQKSYPLYIFPPKVQLRNSRKFGRLAGNRQTPLKWLKQQDESPLNGYLKTPVTGAKRGKNDGKTGL
jgi:hypothetical protein